MICFESGLSSDLRVMLSIAGHDPGGGAGMQADLEAAIAMGVQPVSIISCLTVQDSANVYRLEPVDTELLGEQLACLLDDMPIHACKLGLLGSAGTAELIADLLQAGRLPPVVLDPVLAAGGGSSLSGKHLKEALRTRLLPHTHLLTPNLPEAQALSDQQNPADCAAALCQQGCEQVLITGGHSGGEMVCNQLFDSSGLLQEWHWPRLPGEYHGSGCTLASATAALLAQGIDRLVALEQAQRFTWQSLAQARRIGRHQRTPARHGR
jgi:hydroxymethylpyrimidine/phosphomethylpyrimidine kinase